MSAEMMAIEDTTTSSEVSLAYSMPAAVGYAVWDLDTAIALVVVHEKCTGRVEDDGQTTSRRGQT